MHKTRNVNLLSRKVNNIPYKSQTDLLWIYSLLKFVATRLRMFLIKRKDKANVLLRKL